MNYKEIFFYIFTHRLRRCACCKKIKLCEYIYFTYAKESESNTQGIDGCFCDNCQKLPVENIFRKLKDKQYKLTKTYYEMGFGNGGKLK